MKVCAFFQSLTSVVAPRVVTSVINGDRDGDDDDDDNNEDGDDKNTSSCKLAMRILISYCLYEQQLCGDERSIFMGVIFSVEDFFRTFFDDGDDDVDNKKP